ncbi:MAG: hypothetical protein J2P36_36190, partial [Ktedonobacteraceae bacterium]|nr:hypothetical protein [Ktedonobacteraceae bacterium]
LLQSLVSETEALETMFSTLSGMPEDFFADQQRVQAWFATANKEAASITSLAHRFADWRNQYRWQLQLAATIIAPLGGVLIAFDMANEVVQTEQNTIGPILSSAQKGIGDAMGYSL